MASADDIESERALYSRMMSSIRTGHSLGNTIRMVKLPLILTDVQLYGGAIAQFYWLTEALERALQRQIDDPLVARCVAEIGVGPLAPGYQSDLSQIYGTSSWQARAEAVRTSATDAYCRILEGASPVELVAATFILYGALVIGGGKKTQQKVRKVFPSCDHRLFDVSGDEDMRGVRAAFKTLFTSIGNTSPAAVADKLVESSARFMALNNTVVLSVRCTPFWWWQAAATAVAGFGIGVAIGSLRRRS
mmetsp:Transcript_127650/g.285529  ORF Transcript_127650/g.285529 Transcript_127650/m.285529 type:complete len:248 (-) Transcript_127650:118-861(-)